jgi:hypothetical protein
VDPLAELVRRELRRVHDQIGLAAQALHHEAFLADALDDAVRRRERVPPARGLVSVHEILVGGLQVQDPGTGCKVLKLLEPLRQLAEEHPAPRIDDDSDLPQPARFAGELRHLRQQRRRRLSTK